MKDAVYGWIQGHGMNAEILLVIIHVWLHVEESTLRFQRAYIVTFCINHSISEDVIQLSFDILKFDLELCT